MQDSNRRQADAPPLRFAGRRVLLVEDNVVNQEVAVDLLRSSGLQVETASDGAEALGKAAAGRFDLVLMDVQMPVMDGLAATRALRARLGANLPIVGMTANTSADRQTCLEAGMNDHLDKPIDPVRLQAALQRWLPATEPTAAAVPQGAAEASGTDPAPALETRLAGVPGLDLPAALRSVGGRMALLERILRRFVEHYGGHAGMLPEPTADPASRAALSASCHALRGACATIGANALAADLYALESAAMLPAPDVAGMVGDVARARIDLHRLLRHLSSALGG